MYKTYVIVHGADPYATFADWTPHRAAEWHTHPLGPTDSLVTITFRHTGAKEHLVAIEASGTVTMLPELAFGVTLDAKDTTIAKHPSLVAAGVLGTDSTYKAGIKLHAELGWPHMHPERR